MVHFGMRLSKIAEVLIVLTLGFGLFIYSSTIAFLNNSDAPTLQTYNSYDFIFIVVYEIIILTIIAYYLKHRNWSIKDFNLDFTFKMIGVAILLVVLREGLGMLFIKIISTSKIFSPETINEPSISFQTNIVSIVLMVIVNSIYEEVLLIGYFFKRFEKFHPAIIILISLLIRTSYHTYQGFTNLIMIFLMALIFGLYYVKYKKLWPLIIAHGIGNIYHFLNIQYD